MSWQPLGMLLDSPGGGQALNPSECTKLPSDPGLRTLAASKKYAREMHRYSNHWGFPMVQVGGFLFLMIWKLSPWKF